MLGSIFLVFFSVNSELTDIKSGYSEYLWQILALPAYALMMGLFETILKGKTIGKLITRTTAVNRDGSQISTATAFKRGFLRAVPFCAFSALGSPSNPWQDKWTDTMVVNNKTIQSI
jgi:uncharacterized RDD family membrane protein YckC